MAMKVQQQVRLPAALLGEFRRVADDRGETVAGLLLCFARCLHRAAVRGDPLPADPGPAGPLAASSQYSLSAACMRAADAALAARGTSLTVGLRAMVAVYVAAEGDPAAMP